VKEVTATEAARGFSALLEDYDVNVARAHASLLAHVRRSGTRRGAHDLIIAATALASDRIIVSTDARAFSDLPGVVVR
jgi:tRNA(fMet)-specific endonuclease VapC